jgi:hypothetical protein
MEQTNGFQSFRTRSLLKENGQVSMVFESECFHCIGAFEAHLLKVSALPSPDRLSAVQVLWQAGLRAGRSKAFSPVCLFRFQNFSRFSLLRHSLFEEREEGHLELVFGNYL